MCLMAFRRRAFFCLKCVSLNLIKNRSSDSSLAAITKTETPQSSVTFFETPRGGTNFRLFFRAIAINSSDWLDDQTATDRFWEFTIVLQLFLLASAVSVLMLRWVFSLGVAVVFTLRCNSLVLINSERAAMSRTCEIKWRYELTHSEFLRSPTLIRDD